MTQRWLALAIVFSFSLSACASGGHPGSSGLPALSSAPGSASAAPAVRGKKRVQIKMRMVIGRGKRHRGREGRFVSASTNGVKVVAYAHSDVGHTTPIGTALTDVSSGSNACTNGAGGRTCNVLVIAPAGKDDFVFTLYNESPVGGAIPAGAALLGVGGVTQTIIANQNNTINAAIGAVIAGLSGQPTSVNITSQAQNIGLTISPTDFGNNAITAGSLDAPYANPIAIALVETGGTGHTLLQLNGGTPAASVTSTKASDIVQAVYDGLPVAPAGYSAQVTLTAMAVGGQGGATESATITPVLFVTTNTVFFTAAGTLNTYPEGQHVLTISEPSAAAGTTYTETPSGCSGILKLSTAFSTQTGATLLAVGDVTTSTSGCSVAVSDGTLTYTIAVTNSIYASSGSPSVVHEYSVAASNPFGITTGADGLVWFDENGNSSTLGADTIKSDGTNFTAHTFAINPSVHVTPYFMAAGADGNVWVGDDNSYSVTRVTPSGAATSYTASTQWTNFVAPDLSGNMWFGECNGSVIGNVTPSGVLNNIAVTGGAATQGVALGPDGNIWFTDYNDGKIGKVVAGTPSFVTSLGLASGQAFAITAGSDGNLWINTTDGSPDIVERITTAGVITQFSLPTGVNLYRSNIIAGPDGNIWIADEGNNAIERVTTAGVVTKIIIPTSNASPTSLAVGPDGKIWFTEPSVNKIGVLQY
jgi:streptogramin lyase